LTPLSFQNVGKKYGNFTALEDVSFDIQRGEFFALLGQNGAGKTTLINCLSGISNRTSGKISVAGEDPELHPESTKSKVGVVAQEIAFDPFFTPLEILRLQRGFFGKPKNEEYLLWLLKKLSLFDKKDVGGRQLSGGMKRRLMIAKALVHEPEILILDEPTAGVDVELRQNLWAFMRELRQEKNVTILLTTHYLEEAEALAERVAILHQGKIVVCDETKKILSRHKRILEIETKSGEKKSFEIGDGENMFEKISSCPDIRDIKIREPKLEDIFLEITSSGGKEQGTSNKE
jgi:ABC-2 type transport system ATP-binding protein